MPSRTSSAKGSGGSRVTPSKSQQAAAQNRRYTPPVTREQRHSPGWFPYVIVSLLIFGLLVIIGNYAQLTPGGTKTWYLIVGIGSMVVGLIMATYYR